MKTDTAFDWKALPAVAMAALLMAACGGTEQQTEAVQPPPEAVAEAAPEPEPAPAPAPPPPAPEPEQLTVEASYWADTHWVEGSEGTFLMGLDGGEYPPYKPVVIKELQRFLFDQELYEGPVTGVLDLETMKATGRFQQEHNIVQSGVPSPETREAMEEGRNET